MSEPRYPTRVSDPDETTRIPKEALEGLRDADQAREGGRPNGSASSGPGLGSGSGLGSAPASRDSGGTPGNGSSGAPRLSTPPSSGGRPAEVIGLPSDGAPAVPPASARPPLFAAGANGSGGSPGGFRSEPAAPSAVSAPAAAPPPAISSPAGYPGRSETGYSPAAYQGSFSSAYPSLADAPTAVTGPAGHGPAVGAGVGAAARPSPGSAGRPSPAARGTGSGRPPRRARLLVRHIDPWSTLKFSFVLSVAMFFVWLVAVGVLYGVLDGMGVFDQINKLYDEVSGSGGGRLFSPGLVLGSATVVGAINIVLFTALATIGAFVYNICSDLVGGIEVTLAERD